MMNRFPNMQGKMNGVCSGRPSWALNIRKEKIMVKKIFSTWIGACILAGLLSTPAAGEPIRRRSNDLPTGREGIAAPMSTTQSGRILKMEQTRLIIATDSGETGVEVDSSAGLRVGDEVILNTITNGERSISIVGVKTGTQVRVKKTLSPSEMGTMSVPKNFK